VEHNETGSRRYDGDNLDRGPTGMSHRKAPAEKNRRYDGN
jgi:hypothetical protein